MSSYHWYDLVGSIGAAGIILAFFLIQTGKIKATDIRYSLLNGISASLIVVSLSFNFNFSSFMIELFWIAISLIGVKNWIKEKLVAKRTLNQN